MRLPLWLKPETPEEFRLRMDELQHFMDALVRKTPSDVAGDIFEPTYYGMRVTEALSAGDEEAAQDAIARMLESAPESGMTRLIAAAAYRQLGNDQEALAQIGIGLALDPDNYVLHKHMAHTLLRRGERQAAQAVLEKGWEHCRKHVARKALKEERERYFAVLAGGSA